MSVNYGNTFFAEVSFMVWYPNSVAMEASDPTLQRVEVSSTRDSDNSCVVYQTARVFVAAEFSSLIGTRTVYITPHVTVVASDSFTSDNDSTSVSWDVMTPQAASL